MVDQSRALDHHLLDLWVGAINEPPGTDLPQENVRPGGIAWWRGREDWSPDTGPGTDGLSATRVYSLEAAWKPPVRSRHDDLLVELAGDQRWSAQAVRAVLERVGEGHLMFEPVAVVDAWADGGEAFCVIYTPPWGP